jgi:tetratricopeptide (TPR) repeat protein
MSQSTQDAPQQGEGAPKADPETPDAETAAKLRTAVEHQSEGRFDEARAILNEVLAGAPDNPDALHLLGLVRFAQGRTEEGLALVQRSLEKAPDFAVAQGNLGTMLRLMGRAGEALAQLRRTADTAPDDPLALTNLGYGLLKQGEVAKAGELLLKAVQLAPEDFVAHAGLGAVRLRQQRFQEAEASLRQALGLRPAEAEIHMNLGVALRMLGRHEEAIGSLRVALLLRPRFADALINLGLLLFERGRAAEAAESLRQGLEVQPQRGEGHFALGRILLASGDREGAIASMRRAMETMGDPTMAYSALSGLLTGPRHAGALVELERSMVAGNPGSAPVRVRLARALARAGRLEEAVEACQRAQALDPGSVDAAGTIGAIRYVQGRTEEARASFDVVLALRPDEPVARTTQAMIALARGDYVGGLPGFEARLETPQLAAFRPAGARLPVLAEAGSLDGKRVLLAAEQGQGDTLQFVRYAGLLAGRGAQVLLEVQAPLVPLLEGMPGVSGVTAQGAPVPEADFACPMMSLPLVFGTRLDSIPAAVPYLAAPEERRVRWRARLGAGVPGRRRVGLCWSGNPGFSADMFRSIALSAFGGLLAAPGVEVHLVQTDIREGDDAVVAAHPGVVDLRRELGDFADTAAVLEQMDLVVSVDTAVAHLAGALGRPVWVLLPFASDWRWLEGRSDSPWYPTARLFRQRVLGEWAPVLDDVQAALRAG